MQKTALKYYKYHSKFASEFVSKRSERRFGGCSRRWSSGHTQFPAASRPGTCPVFGEYREAQPGKFPVREGREAPGKCFPPGSFPLVDIMNATSITVSEKWLKEIVAIHFC
ncbi:hypothetical protein L596_010831 [Steinernema carpocapsae]|uniref:Uncharacterized protein n=1 Tax=Steinernema carpocapsae TaxID=34508 RepID=A0A4U5PJT7_STECR|nr:hypothetical protein L596_010831 [Steinernema carpocapsae]